MVTGATEVTIQWRRTAEVGEDVLLTLSTCASSESSGEAGIEQAAAVHLASPANRAAPSSIELSMGSASSSSSPWWVTARAGMDCVVRTQSPSRTLVIVAVTLAAVSDHRGMSRAVRKLQGEPLVRKDISSSSFLLQGEPLVLVLALARSCSPVAET